MHSQAGQVVLMVLLALAVATTIGLAIIGRTSTDVSISNRIEESARAFSAAEAGIEQALVSGIDIGPTVLTSGVNYSVDVTTLGGFGVYQFPAKTPHGTVETLWLTPYDPVDGTFDEAAAFSGEAVDLCWSQETAVPALVVSLFYKEGAAYQVARGAYDPSARGNFTDVGDAGSGCSQEGVYRQAISLSSYEKPLAMRIQPVYSDSQLYIDPLGVELPLQGTRIESAGTTETGVSRKIVAFQEIRTPGAIFDSVIYTSGSFQK